MTLIEAEPELLTEIAGEASAKTSTDDASFTLVNERCGVLAIFE
jgi:hypothetical protein